MIFRFRIRKLGLAFLGGALNTKTTLLQPMKTNKTFPPHAKAFAFWAAHGGGFFMPYDIR
jgi:hypothetical protein